MNKNTRNCKIYSSELQKDPLEMRQSVLNWSVLWAPNLHKTPLIKFAEGLLLLALKSSQENFLLLQTFVSSGENVCMGSLGAFSNYIPPPSHQDQNFPSYNCTSKDLLLFFSSLYYYPRYQYWNVSPIFQFVFDGRVVTFWEQLMSTLSVL